MIKNLLKPNWEPGLSIPQLPTKHLIDVGIKALVLDVDGTLLPRQELILHNSVKTWIKNAQSYFALHLLSNNPSKKRIESISKQLNINFTYRAAKPTKNALCKVQTKLQLSSKEIAIVGDRLFTDVLAGNRLGLYTVLVLPLGSDGEPCKKNRVQLFEQSIARFLGDNKS